MSPSSRGLGHDPFTVGTGVRIPVGTPSILKAALGLLFLLPSKKPPRLEWLGCFQQVTLSDAARNDRDNHNRRNHADADSHDG